MQHSKRGINENDVDTDDCSKFITNARLKDWKSEDLIASIRDRFVTGDWSKASLRNQLSGGTIGDDNDGDDDAIFGEFEDLETGQKHDGNHADDIKDSSKDDAMAAEERRLKKLALRAKFDAQYPFLRTFYTFHLSSFEIGLAILWVGGGAAKPRNRLLACSNCILLEVNLHSSASCVSF